MFASLRCGRVFSTRPLSFSCILSSSSSSIRRGFSLEWKTPPNQFDSLEVDLVTASDRIRRMLASRACRRRTEKLGTSRAEFRKLLQDFTAESSVRLLPTDLVRQALDSGVVGEATNASSLRHAPPLLEKLLTEFECFVKHRGGDEGEYNADRRLQQQRLHQLADMSVPHEWYPLARSMKRKLVVHCGPTNSGKTYSALKHLRESTSGVYCGPLRLLAWEVYDKLTSQGLLCNLMTGQELRTVDDAAHTSCTVEMADTRKVVECAVVDEAQMMGNLSRGHAFTRAVLGLPARTLHLCGDASTVELVSDMCELTGDDFQVQHYTRLGKLRVDEPLTCFSQIRRGDCVVAFSRRQIYRFRAEIERLTGLRVCVVYGSLPPETRQTQARIFNDPNSGYDVLVASDAIGLGLNLNIGRIIFATMEKYDGEINRLLNVSEILQIAGRAGRAFSEFDAGVVTCMITENLRNNPKYLQECMEKKPELLDQAGLSPSFEALESFAAQRPDLSFSDLLKMFRDYATLDGMYFMSNVLDDHIEIASALEHLPLSLRDRHTMCNAPAGSPQVVEYLVKYAEQFMNEGLVSPGIVFEEAIPRDSRSIRDLEGVHNVLELYVWLAYRFPESFSDLATAMQQRRTVQALIQGGLSHSSSRARYHHLRQASLKRRQSRPRKS